MNPQEYFFCSIGRHIWPVVARRTDQPFEAAGLIQRWNCFECQERRWRRRKPAPGDCFIPEDLGSVAEMDEEWRENRQAILDRAAVKEARDEREMEAKMVAKVALASAAERAANPNAKPRRHITIEEGAEMWRLAGVDARRRRAAELASGLRIAEDKELTH